MNEERGLLKDRCLVCGGTELKPHMRELVQCANCSFVTYTKDYSESIYEDVYFNGGDYPDYLSQEPQLRKSMRRHIDFMLKHATPGNNLLEIGSAYGFFLDEIKKHFPNCQGIDICDSPLKHASEKLGCRVQKMDYLNLPSPEQSYEVICMWDTIEHLPRPDLFLEKAHRELQEGGWLFLTTGDIGSLNARWRGEAWRQIHPPSHLHYFSRATMTQLATRVGFEEPKFRSNPYCHSVYNVLSQIGLKGGLIGGTCNAVVSLFGKNNLSGLSFWIDLGDIFFAAMQKKTSL